MFIPIGFGQAIRILPWMIFLMAGICLVWSVKFYPNVKGFNSDTKAIAQGFEDQLKRARAGAVEAACKVRFKNAEYCKHNFGWKPKGTDASKGERPSFKPTIAEWWTFFRQTRGSPESWPVELRRTTGYRQFESVMLLYNSKIRESAIKNNLTIKQNATLWSLLRASFTHGGWAHLLGNLFCLLVFGCWVEQRVGAIIAGLTFLMGSVAGLVIQVNIYPDQAVLGASAGISALMGSFYFYFYRAEFQFIFTMGFIYFQRLWAPLLWTFPCLYLATDLIAIGNRVSSGVAHWAHLGGLLIGVLVGIFVNWALPMRKDCFFEEETPFLDVLNKSNDPKVLSAAFQELIKWNAQNWKGTALYFSRMKKLGASPSQHLTPEVLKKQAANLVAYQLRRGSVEDMISALDLVPVGLDVQEMVAGSAFTQLLHLADKAARRDRFEVALPLYLAARTKTNIKTEVRLIERAVAEIRRLHNEQAEQVAA